MLKDTISFIKMNFMFVREFERGWFGSKNVCVNSSSGPCGAVDCIKTILVKAISKDNFDI